MDSLKPRMVESPSPGLPTKKELSPKPNQVSTVVLYGVPIVSLVIENQERLCLAQISNTLLKQYSYNEIHNRRVALGITCVQCTPVQLEILRRAGAMPVSSRRCGMITRREAERLCKSFLGDNAPPRLPEDFAFAVHHECAWGCRGSFLPSRYNSSRAKCIKCTVCGLFFSPNKFIFHSHRLSPNDKYVQPDAANFNSWRRHMKLSGSPPEEIIHAWEDVKAMFNGGTRKRLLASSIVSRAPKQNKIEPQPQPIVPSPRIPNCQDISLPISRVAMDFIYHKPLAFSSYSSFPWLKRNPILFPQDNPFFPIDKTYQSAFKPVQPVVERTVSQKDEESDDEVDIETTDEKTDSTTNWDLKEEKASDSTTYISPDVPAPAQREEMSAISHKLWNLSRLSFDGTDRTNFLYRQDLHRHFLIGSNDSSSMLRTSVGMAMGLKPNVDCSTCLNHNNTVYPSSESNNKIT
ncbi:SKI family transcriptional corepressor 1 homolog-B [Anoplophora glabripennis]|uniref:SKI family transcriptional corepressor 1 homolog-B n=1 Tax=Anoplophora glabripennis TaxID=217634 RepID=UPI000873C49B|nr:SKI family transcriptional corepressor 1 homolog-B [Anoplophora glabripennis]